MMKRKVLGVLGLVFGIGTLFVLVARAQTPVPPPLPLDLGLLGRLQAFLEALAASGTVLSVGFIVGMLGRFLPFVPNKLVPGLTTIANILLAASMVVRKVVAAASGVSWIEMPWDEGYAMAGIGNFFGSLGIFVGTVTWGFLTTAVQRWLWEKAGKPALVPKSPTLSGGGF